MTRSSVALKLVLTFLFCAVSAASPRSAPAQQVVPLDIRVVSEEDESPIPDVQVRVREAGALTDMAGEVRLNLPVGTHTITAEKIGYAEESLRVTVGPNAPSELTLRLRLEAEEVEGIVVTSTRADRRIEDEPIRVEVLAREEVEEKMLMTPGDISMMLNETSGLRVQSTSPTLGGSNVRIQGLRGRYTQILSDGLPLYGGQSGSLGMLQIPPMDLAQVEVIKGTASALYGSSALGGVINLISRGPEEDEREVLLNQSTLGGTDGVLWLSDTLAEEWGYTFLGGLHRQTFADVDDDGWADLPAYRRAIARPRLFWNDGAGRSVFITAGATLEEREGGTVPGQQLSPAGDYQEALQTSRIDAGLLARLLVGGDRLISFRSSGMRQRHDHQFGSTFEEDLHTNSFAELTYSGDSGPHAWLLGAAFQSDRYDAVEVEGFDFSHSVPSLFAQDEYAPTEWLTLAASGRVDEHSEYGTFVNPRVSLLLRPLADWTVRGSAGSGYLAPTPFTEETEAVGLSRLIPLDDLKAERARSVSLDIGREWGDLELNATLFRSHVEDPIQAHTLGGGLVLRNADAPVRTWGGELLAIYEAEPFHVTASYAQLRSTEADPDGSGRRAVPLTPTNTAGIVGMWESEDAGRVGVELYYTGTQELEENPYRARSRPYFLTGILVERRVGNARLFLNAENILDVRQTRYDPIVLPARSPEGRWTTDAWAPLEGRAFNGGVRYTF